MMLSRSAQGIPTTLFPSCKNLFNRPGLAVYFVRPGFGYSKRRLVSNGEVACQPIEFKRLTSLAMESIEFIASLARLRPEARTPNTKEAL
jgi:hypothetical protein